MARAAGAIAAITHEPATFSSPDRFRAWKVTSNRSLPGWRPDASAAALVLGGSPRVFPRETAVGSLCAYVSGADAANYQPANITFDLLPKLADPPRDRKQRYAGVCRRALDCARPVYVRPCLISGVSIEKYLAGLARENASPAYDSKLRRGFGTVRAVLFEQLWGCRSWRRAGGRAGFD